MLFILIDVGQFLQHALHDDQGLHVVDIDKEAVAKPQACRCRVQGSGLLADLGIYGWVCHVYKTMFTHKAVYMACKRYSMASCVDRLAV